MSANVVEFDPPLPLARRELARYLRELADHIEADEAETEPNAALIVLAGRERYEVLHVGWRHDPGFIRGAIHAAQAVHFAPYETCGGNIRSRSPHYGGGPAPRGGEVVALRPAQPAPEDRT